ncbi:Executer 1 protein [Thalictrum thalictroides]|uniref:Executer 1 protein n=1 Tax=Thalictrum thalictroides TaxID=46969 RepID=A0A7J6XAG5_THATH|nr:Executer 1 protein [Thalictrum thalictroides]
MDTSQSNGHEREAAENDRQVEKEYAQYNGQREEAAEIDCQVEKDSIGDGIIKYSAERECQIKVEDGRGNEYQESGQEKGADLSAGRKSLEGNEQGKGSSQVLEVSQGACLSVGNDELSSQPNAHRVSDSVLCRCHKLYDDSSSSDDRGGWNSQFQDIVKFVIKKIEDYLSTNSKEKEDVSVDFEENKEVVKSNEEEIEEWDWERWKKHFEQVEEQEKIVLVLKSQLGNAVYGEEYEYASKLKVAIAAAASNDVVGRVITQLNRAIEEERYQDAAFYRDYAGAGLMGWWAGISKNSDDPYGRIIHIGVEHGRYVARNFSPRHLATSARGVPLFEIFLTVGSKGEYKQQAVYLKRNGGKFGDLTSSSLLDSGSNISQLNASTDVQNDLSSTSTEDIEDKDDDSDAAEGLVNFQNIPQDMIPGVKVTVLKVTAPEKVDRDLIYNVIEQISEEEEDEEEVDEDEEEGEDEEEEKDAELESVDSDDNDIKAEIHLDEDEIEMVAGGGTSDILKDQSEITFEILIGVGGKGLVSPDKGATLQGQRSMTNVMSDLAKYAMKREKIPMKVLKDVEQLISLTLNQVKNRQPLSGTTTFNRIEIPASSDLLNGLYIGANGLYSSEVIHLSRKFGQWQEDGVKQKRSSLEFYEYVEAIKLTGDPNVPAGQVAFRAKVGKQYQLPHKGIIPEEFGVVARYKGQGRLAGPGFKKPRWVDGELVILDGKYIKGGPVIGFVYWAPDYHFLVFFKRLRLPE